MLFISPMHVYGCIMPCRDGQGMAKVTLPFTQSRGHFVNILLGKAEVIILEINLNLHANPIERAFRSTVGKHFINTILQQTWALGSQIEIDPEIGYLILKKLKVMQRKNYLNISLIG